MKTVRQCKISNISESFSKLKKKKSALFKGFANLLKMRTHNRKFILKEMQFLQINMINNNIEERSSKKEQVGRWFFNLFDWNIKKSPIFLILSKSFLVLILCALTSKLNRYLVGLLHFPTSFYGKSRTVLVTQSRFLQWSEHEQSRIKGSWLHICLRRFCFILSTK